MIGRAPWLNDPRFGGEAIHIRSARESDVDALSDYFSRLSSSSRYNRFTGTVNGFSRLVYDGLVRKRSARCFTIVAERAGAEKAPILGEINFFFDERRHLGEFAISVADDCRRLGIGAALLGAAQSRALMIGCRKLSGDALRLNLDVRKFARRAGFEFIESDDWRMIRFDKALRSDLAA